MPLDFLAQNSQLLGYIAIISGVALVLVIALLPFFIGALPDDYFNEERRKALGQRHPTLSIRLIAVVKNMLGCILVLLGVLMLVLPGQGVLTILMGLILMNYPGKYRLERKLISQPKVLAAINWLRRKQNKREFRLD